jgi:hypothetical protein
MSFRLAIDGDDLEKKAWASLLQSSFPAYEQFWIRHVVPLTGRPSHIHFKDDATLASEGKNAEDLAIAQLHYTTLKHLCGAHRINQSGALDEFGLFVGLSALTGAQDVAFELLQRYTHRGDYDPWIEARPRGKKSDTKSGQDAQDDWKKANNYPLQDVRDYRNKLLHGRTPPAIIRSGVISLPSIGVVDRYCDWRTVTNPGAVSRVPEGDFQPTSMLLNCAWQHTVDYLERMWWQHLM